MKSQMCSLMNLKCLTTDLQVLALRMVLVMAELAQEIKVCNKELEDVKMSKCC